MPDGMSDRTPEDMSDRMPEDMPDRMPEDMPDRMPEDMPDRMPEDLPDRMPEDMPEHLPEDMPDRMTEDMSDRMPEDLPVRKCINVMVGITRSKVIVFVGCNLFLRKYHGMYWETMAMAYDIQYIHRSVLVAHNYWAWSWIHVHGWDRTGYDGIKATVMKSHGILWYVMGCMIYDHDCPLVIKHRQLGNPQTKWRFLAKILELNGGFSSKLCLITRR